MDANRSVVRHYSVTPVRHSVILNTKHVIRMGEQVLINSLLWYFSRVLLRPKVVIFVITFPVFSRYLSVDPYLCVDVLEMMTTMARQS